MSKDTNNFDQNQSTDDEFTYESSYDHNSNENEAAQSADTQSEDTWNFKQNDREDDSESGLFSRKKRSQPAKETTTMSRVIMFSIVILSISPFVLYLLVNSMRPSEPQDLRTTDQIQLERSSQSSEEDDKKESESKESDQESQLASGESRSQTVNTSPVDESQSRRQQPGTQPNEASSTQTPAPTPEPEVPEEIDPTPEPTGGGYTVQAGDSWYGIATANGVDLDTLLSVNGAGIDTPIFPGEVISLP